MGEMCDFEAEYFPENWDGANGIKRPRGRPSAPPTAPISIRVTVAQNEAYKSAGGAKWLKALLDKQIKKQRQKDVNHGN